MPVQTLPFQSLIPIDRTAATPIYQQLANGMIKLIREGKIKPGYGLPASRALAEQMGLNRTTVVAAYEELRIQDWIEVLPRKGIFISSQLPVIKPRTFRNERRSTTDEDPEQDFFLKLTSQKAAPPDKRPYLLIVNDGYPDARMAPLSILFSKYRSLSGKNSLDKLLMSGTVAGSNNLRTELASFLSKTRGVDITADHVMATRGAQLAIYIAARMILKPGSTVIVGALSYHLANEVFVQAGATLRKVKVDENGMDVDEIEKICKEKRPDLLYIIPHHHHPTTVTLSSERRMKLLQIIQKYRLPVIEDDYDYDFHYDNRPILPLASADHKGLVVYIGSITKTLAPSIRMGYIVASKAFIWQAAQLRKVMEIRGDVLMEESVASLYSSGEMQRHINRSVKLYKIRRDMFCEMLVRELGDRVRFNKPSGGMAIWITFDQKYPLPELSKKLAIQGIYMNDGSQYDDTGEVAPNSLRIGFASMNEKEMKVLTGALGELLKANGPHI
jgi:GntR family transcriptional regulator/MocR family aminotransferase